MAKKRKKPPIKIISEKEAGAWYGPSNLFAQSLLSQEEAIQAFNHLSAPKRLSIQSEFMKLDSERGQVFGDDITKDEKEGYYPISVLVDAHIVATMFGTDPVVVLMCVKPPCLQSEKVEVKQ